MPSRARHADIRANLIAWWSRANRAHGRATRGATVRIHAAVEAAAAELDMPVHVEGCEPPADPRLNVIKVTPDPGVIEVNVHPAASWREAVELTQTLYEEARLCRLG